MGNACKKKELKENEDEDEDIANPKKFFSFGKNQKPEYIYKKQADFNLLNNKFTHISTKKQFNENICQILNIPLPIVLKKQQQEDQDKKELEKMKYKFKQRRKKKRGTILQQQQNASDISISALSLSDISILQVLATPRELRQDFLNSHQLLKNIISQNLQRKFLSHYLEPEPFANNFQQQLIKKEYSPLRSTVVLDHQIKEKSNCEVWECFARNDIQRRFQLKIFKGPENYINNKYETKKAYYHSIASLKEDQVVKSTMMYIDKHEIFLEDSPFLLMDVKQCSVLTLEDILIMRKKKEQYFTTEEIIYFLNIFIEIIQEAHNNNIYHGNLSLDKVCLYFNLDKEINYEFIEEYKKVNKLANKQQIELSYADEQIQYKIKHYLYYKKLSKTNQILVRPDVQEKIQKKQEQEEKKFIEKQKEKERETKKNLKLKKKQFKEEIKLQIEQKKLEQEKNNKQIGNKVKKIESQQQQSEQTFSDQSSSNNSSESNNDDLNNKKVEDEVIQSSSSSESENDNQDENEENLDEVEEEIEKSQQDLNASKYQKSLKSQNSLKSQKHRRKGKIIKLKGFKQQDVKDLEEERLIEFLKEQEDKEEQQAKNLLEKQKWMEEQNQKEYRPPRYWPPHLNEKLKEQTWVTLDEVYNADKFSIGLMILSMMRLEPLSSDYTIKFLKMELERHQRKYPLLYSFLQKMLDNSENLPHMRILKKYVQHYRMSKPGDYKFYMEFLKSRPDNQELTSKNAMELFFLREYHFTQKDQDMLLKIKRIHKKAQSYFHLKNFDKALELITNIFTSPASSSKDQPDDAELFVQTRMPFTYKCQLDFHRAFALLKMNRFEVASSILVELHTSLVRKQLHFEEISLYLKCLYYLAYTNFLAQAPQTALQYLQALEQAMHDNKIEDAKSFLMLYTLRSQILSDQGQYQQAYYALQPILQSANTASAQSVVFTFADQALTLFYAGQLLHQLGNTEKAYELMENSLARHAESEIKIMRYGILTEMASQQNDSVAMDEYLENAVHTITSMSVNGKNLEVTANWANLYARYLALNVQKFSQFNKFLSLSYAKNADQICYSSDFLYYCIGTTCFYLQHYQLACQNFLQCLLLKGEMTLYRCLSLEWLAFICSYKMPERFKVQGKAIYQQAIKEYDNYLRVYPTNEFYVTQRKMVINIALRQYDIALQQIEQLDKQLTSIPRDQLMNSQLMLIKAMINLQIPNKKFYEKGVLTIFQTIEFLYSNFPLQPQIFINFILLSAVNVLQLNLFKLALQILETFLPKFEETRAKLSDTTDFLALYGYLQLISEKRINAFKYFKQTLHDLQIHEDKHQINLQICVRQSATIEIIGRLLLQQGKVSESLSCFQKSIQVIEFFQPKRDTDDFAFKFLNIANVYQLLGLYEQALKHCDLSYFIFSNSNNPKVSKQIFFCLAKKCEIQIQLSDIAQSIQLYQQFKQQIQEIFSSSVDALDQQMIAYDTKLQAKLYLRTGNYIKSLQFIEQSITSYTNLYGSKDLSVLDLLILVAEVYFNLKNIVSAKKKITQIKTIIEKQIKEGHVDSNLLIEADIARLNGKLSYLDKKYSEAVVYLDKADSLYQKISFGQIFSVVGDDTEKLLNQNPYHCEIMFYKAECKYANLVKNYKKQKDVSISNLFDSDIDENEGQKENDDTMKSQDKNQNKNTQNTNNKQQNNDNLSQNGSVISQKQIMIDTQDTVNLFDDTEKLLVIFYQGKSPYLPIIHFEKAKINYLTNNFYQHLHIMTKVLPSIGFEKWVIHFLINQRSNRDNDLRRQFNIYYQNKNNFQLNQELQLYLKKFNFGAEQQNSPQTQNNLDDQDQFLFQNDQGANNQRLQQQMEQLKIKYLQLDPCLDHIKFARDMGNKYFPINCDFLKQVEQLLIFINNLYIIDNVKQLNSNKQANDQQYYDNYQEEYINIKNRVNLSKSF